MKPISEWLDLERGRLRLYRYGADASLPKLHFAHATGFHARMYEPLYRLLEGHFQVIALDMRGHGESRDLAREPFSGWEDYYADLGVLIGQEGPLYMAGHSFGATTSLIAASRNAPLVRGVLLVEPVLMSPLARTVIRVSRWIGVNDRVAIAQAAARRRSRFASRAEALASYRRKKFFKWWSAEWLEAYVEYGFFDTQDGIELACPPAFESQSFAQTEYQPWRKLLPMNVPVTGLAATEQSTFAPASKRTLTRKLPDATVHTIVGASHMLPVSHTELVAKAAADLISRSTKEA